MKNGENYNRSRRNFLKGIGVSLLLFPLLQSCKQQAKVLLMRLTGKNHILGHRLWAKNFPKASEQIHIPYLIVGGGISGLSAARQFHKKGISNFLLVELEDQLGGNSSHGENAYSKYPLGAHYLPLPNFEDKALLQFLEEEKIILGYDANGLAVYDEQQLTFTPQERLFYKNSWHEGLVPKFGNSEKDNSDFDRFFTLMENFRTAKGSDGKYLFDIPLSFSSSDAANRALDKLTMKNWLNQQQFSSKALFEYVDYCSRDDFGIGIEFVSAWAGIHYFAARKHDSSADKKENVLTWPEGNARLATHLKKYTKDKTLKNHLVFDLKIVGSKVVALVFDSTKNKTIEIIADQVVVATPQFVNQYFLEHRKKISSDFHYAPWLLATLTLSDLPDDYGFPLCWDNVIHGTKGLGYIYDQHQSLQQLQAKKVITYYCSFSASDLKKSRRQLYQTKKADWKKWVFDDLKTAHPNLEINTESIEIHLLGHGMISPVPGFLFGDSRKKAAAPIAQKIYFAHSDLSGISIFEEAFHQGIHAVNQMLDETTVDS